MNTQKRLHELKRKLLDLGPVLPGSISEQWNVCGTPGCRCKERNNPKKHGPYYQLSFSIRGRSSSMFIKKEDLAEARKRVHRHQEFKKLMTNLIRAYVEQVREEGFGRVDND